MSTQNDFTRGFATNTALSAFRRVATSNNGSLNGYSGANNFGLGVLQQDLQGAAWEVGKVRFYGTGTIQVAVTAVPATAGDTIYLAANGMVANTGASTAVFGVLIGPNAGTNGDVCEVLPLLGVGAV